jgi:hypothetical protein
MHACAAISAVYPPHAQVVIRLPTRREWRRNTYFSNCTLPIVFYENWPHNLIEFLQR